jgi:protoporphyrinogen oxidase
MKVGIIGAGITGLTAAYDLLNAGHQVTLYEANSYTGGLAAGFRDQNWDWSLEHYYHHLFRSDKDIISLVHELGMGDDLFWPRPITSVIYRDQIVPFDSPMAWITFPGFNLVDVARFGLVGAYLRFSNPWRRLEKDSADSWLQRWYGDKIYQTVWRPMLIGKFGPYYQEANMAWMWARLKVRSTRLGYFKGGFQAFVNTLTMAVKERGGQIVLDCPIHSIKTVTSGQITVVTDGEASPYDRCLVTTSPALLGQMAPDLPEDYLKNLADLKSMGAVVLVLALKQRLMDGTYWLNLPADSPDKVQNDFPFLALVEHTNYVDRRHYGGDHLVYCGDYVGHDHAYLDMSKQELESLFLSVLPKFNPQFRPEWLRKSWLFRTRYAQPVPKVNHSQNIPEIRTPIHNLYFASMSQVYPWDRGTNYAVEIGRKAAKEVLDSRN